MNATSTLEVIELVKKSVSNPKPNPWRMGQVNDIGEWGRQGDVYITKIAKPSEKLTKIEKFNGQLAEGTNKGSRHCVDVSHVDAYQNPSKAIEKGPILYVKKGTEITHPDHGHVILEKDIWIEVTYQVNFAKQERARVQD